jgi:hypothetical protein
MRNYILTDHEREIIKAYLKTGEKVSGFRLVKSVAQKIDLNQIDKDRALLERFLEKLKKEGKDGADS